MSKTIAIFCAGQWGDCATISSVLKYRNELWGDAKIVWYISKDNADLLKYQDIEVREFPRGFGYPIMVHEENKKLIDAGKEPIWQDWKPLVDEKNHMNLSLKHNYPSLADIDFGFFPAPHQIDVTKIHGVDYPNVSRKIFAIPDHYEWHPVLAFSEKEADAAFEFVWKLPEGKKILFETFAGSSQSTLSDEMVKDTISICREHWPECVFIFASHKYLRAKESFPENFFEQPDVFSCAYFTVRQCALISDYCRLIISVSSGISVACSRWGRNNVPLLQFCGSFKCSTVSLYKGSKYELVTYDTKPFESAKEEFYQTLIKMLNE